MPRKKREVSATGVYHVIIKGTNSQLMFEERKDYLKYLDILEYQKSQCNYKIYAYCLMSNHVHLLIRATTTPLDTIFKKINTTYSCWFNMKYKRSGPLQDGRYYSEPVNDLTYFFTVLRYIHFNPTKAGLEESPGKSYEWYSYYAYVQQLQTFIDTESVLKIMDGIDAFKKFHTTANSDDCLDIDKIKKRIPDDVAIDIIKNVCNVTVTTDVSEFPILERNQCVHLCKDNGLSANQINRLTGIPRGIVERILANRI